MATTRIGSAPAIRCVMRQAPVGTVTLSGIRRGLPTCRGGVEAPERETGPAIVSCRLTGSYLTSQPPRSQAASTGGPTKGPDCFGPTTCRAAAARKPVRPGRAAARRTCTSSAFRPVRGSLAHRHRDGCGAAGVIAIRCDATKNQRAPHRHTTRLDHRQTTCPLTVTPRKDPAGASVPP